MSSLHTIRTYLTYHNSYLIQKDRFSCPEVCSKVLVLQPEKCDPSNMTAWITDLDERIVEAKVTVGLLYMQIFMLFIKNFNNF